jgi:hypothetical protein
MRSRFDLAIRLLIAFVDLAVGREGPLKLPGSQLEPVKWTELAGQVIASRRWLRETTREVRAGTRTLRDQR